MGDDRQEQLLDVLGQDVVALLEQRPGAGGVLEREAAADGGADRDAVELARRADEVDDPALEELVDVDVLDGVLELPRPLRR